MTPPGSAARRSPVVRALATSALFVASWSCLHVWFFHDEYAQEAGEDVVLYQSYGEAMKNGDVPYRDFAVVYPPGASSCDEDSLVRHGGKEYGYVLRGRLGVRIGFDEYQLTPGMAISFDSSSPHRLWAVGDEAAEAVWVVVGRQGQPGSG